LTDDLEFFLKIMRKNERERKDLKKEKELESHADDCDCERCQSDRFAKEWFDAGGR